MKKTRISRAAGPGFIALWVAALLFFCPGDNPVQGAALPEDVDAIEEIEEIEEVEPAAVGGFGTWRIVLVLGIVNFALLLFQLGTGLRFIKVKFGVHKKTGIVLFICALIHGMLALFF